MKSKTSKEKECSPKTIFNKIRNSDPQTILNSSPKKIIHFEKIKKISKKRSCNCFCLISSRLSLFQSITVELLSDIYMCSDQISQCQFACNCA